MLLALAAAFSGSAAQADTPGNLQRSAAATSCYCKCDQGRTHAGCSRICDSSRRALRWGSQTCAKPRLRKPADSPGAGPRLPHPPRAERASN
jgi:hypothetical protein